MLEKVIPGIVPLYLSISFRGFDAGCWMLDAIFL